MGRQFGIQLAGQAQGAQLAGAQREAGSAQAAAQEGQVEAQVVADQQPPLQGCQQLAGDRGEARLIAQLGIQHPAERGDRARQRLAGVEQPAQAPADPPGIDQQHGDLPDAVALRVQAGGFHIQHRQRTLQRRRQCRAAHQCERMPIGTRSGSRRPSLRPHISS